MWNKTSVVLSSNLQANEEKDVIIADDTENNDTEKKFLWTAIKVCIWS